MDKIPPDVGLEENIAMEDSASEPVRKWDPNDVAIEASTPQHPTTVSNAEFSQMDNLARARFFYSMSNSFGDLKLDRIDRKRPLLRLILRRSFSPSFAQFVSLLALILFVGTSATTEILLHHSVLRKVPDFVFFLTAPVISIALSVAAGATYAVLGFELSFKLRSIERRFGSADNSDTHEPAE